MSTSSIFGLSWNSQRKKNVHIFMHPDKTFISSKIKELSHPELVTVHIGENKIMVLLNDWESQDDVESYITKKLKNDGLITEKNDYDFACTAEQEISYRKEDEQDETTENQEHHQEDEEDDESKWDLVFQKLDEFQLNLDLLKATIERKFDEQKQQIADMIPRRSERLSSKQPVPYQEEPDDVDNEQEPEVLSPPKKEVPKKGTFVIRMNS